MQKIMRDEEDTRDDRASAHGGSRERRGEFATGRLDSLPGLRPWIRPQSLYCSGHAQLRNKERDEQGFRLGPALPRRHLPEPRLLRIQAGFRRAAQVRDRGRQYQRQVSHSQWGKAADTKTAATRESWDAHKLAPTRELADGRRLFLGREHDKLGKSSDPKELAKWQTGETVTYSDGQIEKVSTLKPLSVEDVRDLLNKSK